MKSISRIFFQKFPIQEDPAKKRLSDLFDSSQIFDTSRPTPVTWNYGQTQNETPANETTAAQQ